MPTSDALGDRMKWYERQETGAQFLPMLPLYARIDGRGFSRFTQGLDRPYDARFRALMLDTTRHLVEQTGARCGYTQSDEISLCWLAERYDSGVFFEAKKQKMLGQLAAIATQRFNRLLWSSDDGFLRTLAERDPTFDARLFQMPNREECANAFLWREMDATKNALTMAAGCYYSHQELQGKNGADKNDMLFAKGVNFNDYPNAFKRGVFVQRQVVERAYTDEELQRIPAHRHPEPGTLLRRSKIVALDLPPFGQVANRADVIFDAAPPVLFTEVAPDAPGQTTRARVRP